MSAAAFAGTVAFACRQGAATSSMRATSAVAQVASRGYKVRVQGNLQRGNTMTVSAFEPSPAASDIAHKLIAGI